MVAIAVLVPMAIAGRQSFALGAVPAAGRRRRSSGRSLDGLILGHWYLTDRGLSRGPINRITTIMLVSVVLEAVAVISGGFEGTSSSQAVNPLLTSGALAPWIALGMIGTTALIAVLTRAALKGDARLGRAVGHGLLLPGRRHRVHRRARRQDAVPAELSDADRGDDRRA